MLKWPRMTLLRQGKDRKEKDKFNKFAFTVIRQFEKRSDPADFLFTTLLDIKSPNLRKACEDVIGNVKGILLDIHTSSGVSSCCNIIFCR